MCLMEKTLNHTVEEFQTNPQSVYGKTKLDGENEMRDINPNKFYNYKNFLGLFILR